MLVVALAAPVIAFCQAEGRSKVLAGNIGKILPAKRWEGEVEYQNLGMKPLRVIEVRSKNPGAEAWLDPRVLPSGQTGMLNLALDLSMRRGPFSEVIEVITDDPLQSPLECRVEGIVVQEVEVSRASLEFSNLKDGVRWREIQLQFLPTTPISGIRLDALPAWIQVVPAPASKGDAWPIRIGVDPRRLPEGDHGTEIVVLALDHPRVKQVPLTVNWSREHAFRSSTEALLVPRKLKEYRPTLEIGLSRFDNAPFAIRKVTVVVPGLALASCKEAAGATGKAWSIALENRVLLKSWQGAGTRLGTLLVETDDPIHPAHEIPVRVGD